MAKKDKNTTGLPRPWALTAGAKTNEQLAKKVPIPWQSVPNFKTLGVLGLNIVNEKSVYENGLCPYCGIKLNDNETTQKWTPTLVELTTELNGKVFSDFYSFHLECMDQARMFCPFMKKLKDKNFKIGLHKDLKQEALSDVNKIKEFQNEKITEKDL